MKILLTFDSNFAPHACSLIESIIDNSSELFGVEVLYHDLKDDEIDKFNNHFKNRLSSLVFHKITEEKLSSFDKISTATHLVGFNAFLRLLAPLFIEDEFILYLDVDTLVVADLQQHVKDNIPYDHPIGATLEYDKNYKRATEKFDDLSLFVNEEVLESYFNRKMESLRMSSGRYFNSGVMIINLKYWRENHTLDKVLKFIDENKSVLFSADQDALNAIFDGNIKVLPPSLNSISVAFSYLTNYGINNLKEAERNPVVIHAAGAVKLWDYMNTSRYSEIYWKYRKLTPWPDVVYRDRTLKNILFKKMISLKFFIPLSLRNKLRRAIFNRSSVFRNAHI